MSLLTLLQAAEYIERKDREAEHGYATSLPVLQILPHSVSLSTSPSPLHTSSGLPGGSSPSSSPPPPHAGGSTAPNSPLNNRQTKLLRKTIPATGSRSSHNELEKNRRAHLRSCLENLKDLVPLGSDTSRHTTLGLLNKAKYFIKNLEDKDRKSQTQKDNLFREQRYLRRRLELLSCQVDAISKRRSISESSSSTISSIQSSVSESEVDGHLHSSYSVEGGAASDDDHSSVQSAASDGGVTVTTWKQLTIANV
eukprot:TRINITY_DN32258_c0_g1_i1.p1 TRINITY_DN32258_c0_g1~~TRINITY_DN32258_c0_g1_i1.p1  ORF type:complete len:253 (-),score=55.37 TRINITY_DN32258_c0_g1_i1:101-859(-)